MAGDVKRCARERTRRARSSVWEASRGVREKGTRDAAAWRGRREEEEEEEEEEEN